MKYLVSLTTYFILSFPIFCGPAYAQDPVVLASAINNIKLDHEALLVKAIEDIRDNRLDAALSNLEQLVKINPQFRLAQLMYADLLLAHSRPVYDFGNVSYASYEDISGFRKEAQARWRHHLSASPARGKVPKVLAQLDNKQKYVILVDLSKPRLYLFENRQGVPVLINDFYVSIGKNGSGKLVEGDQRTPFGVYFVTEFKPPTELPEFYGEGAFPIDYPNAWDRRNGRTGYGIWLHGTPFETYSRPPLDSDGCVILSNQYFLSLAPYIDVGNTPVIMAEHVDWISRADWTRQQQKLESVVEQWRKDWESRDVDLYLSHYSSNYFGLGKDYESWVEHKRRVSPAKKFIKVSITNKSVFMYPGVEGLMVVTFEQDYLSDSFEKRFIKRQYWQQEKDGKWRIVYEGSVS